MNRHATWPVLFVVLLALSARAEPVHEVALGNWTWTSEVCIPVGERRVARTLEYQTNGSAYLPAPYATGTNQWRCYREQGGTERKLKLGKPWRPRKSETPVVWGQDYWDWSLHVAGSGWIPQADVTNAPTVAWPEGP